MLPFKVISIDNNYNILYNKLVYSTKGGVFTDSFRRMLLTFVIIVFFVLSVVGIVLTV